VWLWAGALERASTGSYGRVEPVGAEAAGNAKKGKQKTIERKCGTA